ncbi:hypothetical protein BU107_05830 [Staphylococcus xylosus]|uniref:phage baseplate protein n=1 Tax=Staphylococcus xylosus TaxID=1288 RepID=UPI000E681F8D|nr:hypothetical protein [Staphylococcus xylosus]RIM88319.1 hypothetical protein BU107_05830 [Staphylococcus xylosus]
MINLKKSLSNNMKDFRNDSIRNTSKTEKAINRLFNMIDKAKVDNKIQHHTKQIKHGHRTQNDVNQSLQSQINHLAVSPRDNSANEIVQARVDMLGNRFPTLKEHLDAWEERTFISKNETIQALNESKKEVLDIEYRFEPNEQEFLPVTELSPLTNSVMQSFWVDNRQGVIYMTQARSGGYKLTRLKPNGQEIDNAFVRGGGHGTHNGYRYIDDELWIYSFIEDSNKQGHLVRFKYQPGVEYTYGTHGMKDVFTGHSEQPYLTPVINEKEGLILFRIEYSQNEWEQRNSRNYIEIRSLEDIEKEVDNVLYQLDIPMHLTTSTQPMQGVGFDESTLYWYTGDSNVDNPNYLTAFDLETKVQLYQREINIGGVIGLYPGNFQEAEGLQVYYDYDTGKKALMLGVTVGGDGNRNHHIYMIGQRGILESLRSRGTPYLLTDTGGRVKPLPIRPEGLTSLKKIKEPGFYYLYTNHTFRIDDFPMPRKWRDAGWWLEVKPPQTNGDVIQILTRNSFGRNMVTFERVISGQDRDDSNTSDWNYVYKNSGKWERVPSSITDISEINIVGMTFYLTSDDTKRLSGFPEARKGHAGYILEVKPLITGGFRHELHRNNVAGAPEILSRNYDSQESPGVWGMIRGEVIS